MNQLRRTTPYDALGFHLREIRKIPLLTQEEEVALARRAKAGDRAAVHELVRRNLRFVVSVAKQYAYCDVPLGDLVSEGNLGLIKGAERFDVDRGYRFITYAVWWVRQAILQYLAERSRTVRLPVNKSTTLTKVTRASQRLSQHLGRDPRAEELARFLGMKTADVENILSMPVTRFSIDEPTDGRDHEFQVDTITDETSMGPEDSAVEIERNEDIKLALAALSPREEDILKRWVGLDDREPQTLEQIGQVYGVSRERVRQIRIRAIEQLRKSPHSSLLREHFSLLEWGPRPRQQNWAPRKRTMLDACHRPRVARALERR